MRSASSRDNCTGDNQRSGGSQTPDRESDPPALPFHKVGGLLNHLDPGQDTGKSQDDTCLRVETLRMRVHPLALG